MATFIKSQRGSKKLLHEDYTYNIIRRADTGRTYWRCDETSLRCTATAVTDKNGTVKVYRLHNHMPSKERVALKMTINNLKENAMLTDSRPQEVIDDAMRGLDDSLKAHLPKLASLERQVTRIRKSAGINYYAPRSLAKVDIPEELHYTKTTSHEKFILEDTGEGDPHRVIVLGCNSDICRLMQCQTWIIDGTFKCPSESLFHLWVIYGVFNEKTIPLVYSLLPNKQQATYERVLEIIFKSFDASVRPTCLITDFERAAEDAFKKLVPEIRIEGCFFHFSQSIWQKIKELGLVDKYNLDPFFRTMMKSFSGLAFVPPRLVLETFESMANELIESLGEEEAYHDFFDYFVNTWVGRRYPKRTPRVPIQMWNCNQITIDDIPLTTSLVELWHHAYSTIFTRTHTNPYKLVAQILEEHMRVDYICQQLEEGEHNKHLYTTPECKASNTKLIWLIRNFEDTDIGEFLTNCGDFAHYA